MLEKVFMTLVVAVIALNAFAGLVASIWLVFSGQWFFVLFAWVGVIIAYWVLGLLLAGGLLFVLPVSRLMERRRYTGIIFLSSISLLWTYLLVVGTVTYNYLYVFENYFEGLTLPYLLMAYAVSTAPWLAMAKNEMKQDGDSPGTIVVSNVVCTIALLYLGLFAFNVNQSFQTLLIVGLVPAAIGLVIQIFMLRKQIQVHKTQTFG